ncbi:G glu transpept domain containing protein, partial [Asbolus verrucosus]
MCALVGSSILKKGGSAVDAAIASLFCEGVSLPHCAGLGGGFLMTIYIKESGTVETLNARETAPGLATEDMFDGDESLSTKGGLAVAIPGELRGYWEAYKKYGGKVPWRDLVQPTIDLCKNGILVTEFLASVYSSQQNQLYKDPILRETFINPATNETYKLNEYVKRPRLAKTLELIAKQGADVLYNGSLTKGFVADIKAKGGIITEEDINNYKVEWKEPIKIDMPFNQVLYTSPLPGSGVILGFIMNILNGFLNNADPLS